MYITDKVISVLANNVIRYNSDDINYRKRYRIILYTYIYITRKKFLYSNYNRYVYIMYLI